MYDLSGGALMDLGSYKINVLRSVIGTEAEECLDCTVRKCEPPYELCGEGGDAVAEGGGESVTDTKVLSLAGGWGTSSPGWALRSCGASHRQLQATVGLRANVLTSSARVLKSPYRLATKVSG